MVAFPNPQFENESNELLLSLKFTWLQCAFDTMQNGNGKHLPIRIIDLFCGIGGFRFAAEAVAKRRHVSLECVFSSDIDSACRVAYAANFGHTPCGDITKIAANDIADHDLLLAGFPCQPFSIIGHLKGFEVTRGTLLT